MFLLYVSWMFEFSFICFTFHSILVVSKIHIKLKNDLSDSVNVLFVSLLFLLIFFFMYSLNIPSLSLQNFYSGLREFIKVKGKNKVA